MVSHKLKGTALLRMWRTELFSSQEACAEAAGISESFYKKIESGARQPSFDVVKQLAVALHLTGYEYHMLFMAYGYTAPGRACDQAAAIIHLDTKLTSEQRVRMASMIQRLYDTAVLENTNNQKEHGVPVSKLA
jgi:transcriptional regulator with XRE-family HTH domain